MSATPELAALEKLITARAHERAETMVKDALFNFGSDIQCDDRSKRE